MRANVWVFCSEEACIPSCYRSFLDLFEGKLWFDELIKFVFKRCTEFLKPSVDEAAAAAYQFVWIQIEVDYQVRIHIKLSKLILVG